MTSLTTIYQKALRSIDDPELTVLMEVGREIELYKMMHEYWENAWPRFDNPFIVAVTLRTSVCPHDNLVEDFPADGITQTFEIPEEFDLTRANCLYEFRENGKVTTATIEDGEVTFANLLPLGDVYTMEQYFIGGADLSSFAGWEQPKIIDILSMLVVRAWGEELRNYLLGKQNILNTPDFPLHSNASNTQANEAWLKNMDSQIAQYMNQFSWQRRVVMKGAIQ